MAIWHRRPRSVGQGEALTCIQSGVAVLLLWLFAQQVLLEVVLSMRPHTGFCAKGQSRSESASRPPKQERTNRWGQGPPNRAGQALQQAPWPDGKPDAEEKTNKLKSDLEAAKMVLSTQPNCEAPIAVVEFQFDTIKQQMLDLAPKVPTHVKVKQLSDKKHTKPSFSCN